VANEQTAEEKAQNEVWARKSATLKSLVRSEAWDLYIDLIGKLENETIQELIGSPASDHDRLSGFINGLRKAVYLPHQIINSVDNRL
jgi:hypothetical protein